MKLRNLSIKDYNQFKDITLDLTYPIGHIKEGQALEKICIIGQSGTGKTQLLKIIALAISARNTLSWTPLLQRLGLRANQGNQFFTMEIENNEGAQTKLTGLPIEFFQSDSTLHKLDNLNPQPAVRVNDIFKRTRERLEKLKELQDSMENIGGLSAIIYLADSEPNPQPNDHLIIVSPSSTKALTVKVQQRIAEFRKNDASYRIASSRKFLDNDEDSNSIKKEYLEYKLKNPNPIYKLADEYLDIILENFYLVTERDDTELGVNEIRFRHKGNDQIISLNDLSTGIKHIVNLTIPLYFYGVENTMLLVDEPERGLYPDIQQDIISYFDKFKGVSQSIYATHSPIIASSFDPWEIVELKFDENGFAFREEYFEGERHVKNYKVFPKYLKYNEVLTKVFDLESTFNQDRSEIIYRIEKLKDILDKFKQEGKNVKEHTAFKNALIEYKHLSDKILWDKE